MFLTLTEKKVLLVLLACPSAGQKPLPMSSSFFDPGFTLTTGCVFFPTVEVCRNAFRFEKMVILTQSTLGTQQSCLAGPLKLSGFLNNVSNLYLG